MGVTEILQQSFADFWAKFTSFLPTILLALILLFAGFLLAWLFEVITRKMMKVIYFEKITEKMGLKSLFEKAGLRISITRLLSGVVYWFVLIVFLAAVVKALNLNQIYDFLNKLIAYLPNLIAAVVILIIGILVANLLSNIVKNSSEAAKLKSAKCLAGTVKWVILVFAVIAALVQLKIAPDLLKILFTGFVVMLALAGGLAFGLGGKEAAKDVIEKFKEDVSKKE